MALALANRKRDDGQSKWVQHQGGHASTIATSVRSTVGMAGAVGGGMLPKVAGERAD